MNSTTAAERAAAHRGGLLRLPRGRMIVAALAITQTIGYGVLYYAFSVLLTPMAQDLHATGPQIALGFTISLLTMAVCAPMVGRHLDAHGGRALMTAGSLLGTLALLGWSQVRTLPQLYTVFAVVGLASAMVLYEAAFAVVVTWFTGNGRATALLAITIVAGFASAIFLPVTGLLVDLYGWRHALVILAALYGATAVPLHALVVRRHPGHVERATSAGDRADLVLAAVRARPFWLLTIAFTANGAAVSTMTVLVVTYLVDLGHRPVFAATIAGLLGVLSVTGRLVTTGLRRHWPIAPVAAAFFALQGVGAMLLPLIGRTQVGAVGCVLLFGLGFGIASITLPHLLADRYGVSAYATLSGRVALFSRAAKTAAPLGAVALAQAAGYGWVMAAITGACGTAAFALLAYHRLRFRQISK